MPGAHRCRHLDRGLLQFGVVAVRARQAGSGSLVEGDPEFDPRRLIDQRFIDIFHGLDEMALTEDNVRVLRNPEIHRMKFEHSQMD
jgi:hypothetical protein